MNFIHCCPFNYFITPTLNCLIDLDGEWFLPDICTSCASLLITVWYLRTHPGKKNSWNQLKSSSTGTSWFQLIQLGQVDSSWFNWFQYVFWYTGINWDQLESTGNFPVGYQLKPIEITSWNFQLKPIEITSWNYQLIPVCQLGLNMNIHLPVETSWNQLRPVESYQLAMR